MGLVLLASAMGIAAAQAAEPVVQATAWDQAKVTQIAQGLADSLKDLKLAADANPMEANIVQQKAREEAKEGVTMMTRTSRELANKLEKGADKAATKGLYQRLGSLQRTTADDARRVMLTQDIIDRVDAAKGWIAQLAPYYQ
jgi:hypothetical protein